MFYLILLTIVTVTFLIFLSIVFVHYNKRMMERDKQEHFRRLIEEYEKDVSKIEISSYSLGLYK